MRKFLLPVIFLFFVFPVIAQQSVSLKLNLEKNKIYRFRSVSRQTTIQTINDNQQTVETEVLQTFSIKMLDATPEFMVTEVHFDTLTTKNNTMGKIENISSAVEGDIKSSEAANVMSCIMNRLSRNAIFVKMDYSGQPVEIMNAKLLSDMILKDTSSITIVEPTASALKTQITNIVSENNLKTMIKNFTWHLPGNQIRTGDTWKIFDQINSGGILLTVASTYRLDGIKGNNAAITIESEIKVPENAPPIKSGGATVLYNDLTGLAKSNLLINITSGLPVENRSKSRISGKMNVSAPGFNMDMPMDINSESVLTIIN